MPHQFNENLPIYLQIIRRFEVAVARGELAQGAKLPSVRETAIEMQVNPNTVQRAYQEMERIGFVTTKRGQGSYVTDDPVVLTGLRDRLAQESIERFITEMAALGIHASELAAMLANYAHRAGNGQSE